MVADQYDSSTGTFRLGAEHFTLAALGYISLDLAPYTSIPIGTETPTFYVETQVSPEMVAALGEDVRVLQEDNGFSAVQFYVSIGTRLTEVGAPVISEDGESIWVDGHVTFAANRIGLDYLRALGISPTLGETLTVAAKCVDESDFLGNPLISLQSMHLSATNGRPIWINLHD